MEFLEVVKNRKSIRIFSPKVVPSLLVSKILEVVNLAPSAGNLQAYKIYVISDLETRKQIAHACNEQEFIAQAPIALVFCADAKRSASKYGNRGKNLYAVQDATIAAAFTTLAAVNQKLATCWVGAFNENKIRQILNTKLLPVVVMPSGFGAENPPRRTRKTLTELVEFIK